MLIEISIANSKGDNYEHYSYCDNIEDAIDRLKELQKREKEAKQNTEKVRLVKYRLYKGRYCDKCVWYLNSCGGPMPDGNGCPPNKTYKRDPPDGGYYG